MRVYHPLFSPISKLGVLKTIDEETFPFLRNLVSYGFPYILQGEENSTPVVVLHVIDTSSRVGSVICTYVYLTIATSPYEWKILEWDDKPQSNKQTFADCNIIEKNKTATT